MAQVIMEINFARSYCPIRRIDSHTFFVRVNKSFSRRKLKKKIYRIFTNHENPKNTQRRHNQPNNICPHKIKNTCLLSILIIFKCYRILLNVFFDQVGTSIGCSSLCCNVLHFLPSIRSTRNILRSSRRLSFVLINFLLLYFSRKFVEQL